MKEHSASEAFALLGLSPGSSAEEIRKAWRAQSLLFHPDTGGSNESMITLNAAVEIALSWREGVKEESPQDVASTTKSHTVHQVRRDVSSFTVNVLPVDCWQALEVVASLCGPTVHDDPPYLMEFLLHDSSLMNSRNAWCRCECVPEAGGTTVHLTVGSSHDDQIPHIVDVRDFLVDQLNNIDWPS
jgi:hypothetical protein